MFVLPEGPAEKAGMKTGAEITEFNGKPIDEAIQAVKPHRPHSIESTLRYEQARYLLRAPAGYQSHGHLHQPQTALPPDGRAKLSPSAKVFQSPHLTGIDPNALPVEYVVSSAGIGYVRINSNYDDLNLIIRLFQRALTKFKENNLETLIIDMRENSGGAPLGLAGFLTDQEIPLGQLEYYSDKTGKFEPEGPSE